MINFFTITSDTIYEQPQNDRRKMNLLLVLIIVSDLELEMRKIFEHTRKQQENLLRWYKWLDCVFLEMHIEGNCSRFY